MALSQHTNILLLAFSNQQLVPILIQESSHWLSPASHFGPKLKNLPKTFPAVIAARPSMISSAVVPTRQKYTNLHTHPFNGPFSGTTQVSRYQKGKTNLNFTEARDSEWQWHQLGHMQVCTLLRTDNHTSTPPLCFLQAGCPSCHPTNSVKALKAPIYSPHKTKREQKRIFSQQNKCLEFAN